MSKLANNIAYSTAVGTATTDDLCSMIEMAQENDHVDDHILLLDLAHRHFQLRTLNVGMSRATHGKYVHLATRGEEYVLLSHAPQVQRPAAAAPPEQRREDSDSEEAAEWRAESDTESE